jgi:predicted DNA-binding protein YlxM (UPF0122 family)
MHYVKMNSGELLSLKEIAEKYNVSLRLIEGRYYRGIRDISKLTQPKYEMLRK